MPLTFMWIQSFDVFVFMMLLCSLIAVFFLEKFLEDFLGYIRN